MSCQVGSRHVVSGLVLSGYGMSGRVESGFLPAASTLGGCGIFHATPTNTNQHQPTPTNHQSPTPTPPMQEIYVDTDETVEQNVVRLKQQLGSAAPTDDELTEAVEQALADYTRCKTAKPLTRAGHADLQEATRQLSAMANITLSEARRHLLHYGISRGFIAANSKAPPLTPLPERPCLNCGKLKRHNNSFCSTECAREWKSQ